MVACDAAAGAHEAEWTAIKAEWVLLEKERADAEAEMAKARARQAELDSQVDQTHQHLHQAEEVRPRCAQPLFSCTRDG